MPHKIRSIHSAMLSPCSYLLAAILFFSSDMTQADTVYNAEVSYDIRATPTTVDEGEIVNFELFNLIFTDPELGTNWKTSAHTGEVEWVFPEGTTDTAFGLNKVAHRFINGTDSSQTVRANLLNATQAISVQVRNVRPTIHRMWHSTPLFQDQPVKFHALATDPGLVDVLTYTWDFGDGSTATGQHVEHRFSSTGNYQVTLTVADESSFDTQSMDVVIGWNNSFSVTGEVSLSTMPIDGLIVAASTRNPLAREKSGACQVRLEIGNRSAGISFALTASLDPGFGVREYAIGETTEWDGSHQDDANSPGTFFANLSLPASIAYRDFSGTKVGGPFWSQDGQVTVHSFDGKQLELSFSADILEMTPLMYQPRQMRVVGQVSTALETSPSGVLKGVGDVFSAFGNNVADPDAPSSFQGANFYLCGSEESGDFEIESWNPFSNEIGVAHQEPQIEVTFTEQVDPESLADNAHLEFRTENGLREMPGGWEVKPDDPKTIQFIPQAYLFPAVIYCIRIDANEDGLRSVTSGFLRGSESQGFSAAMRPACQDDAASNFGSNTRRSAFATRVEFASLRVDLYQSTLVADPVVLIPHKPTLARVYPYWKGYAPVHPTAMVTQIDAKVSMSGNVDMPTYQPIETTIRRPDQYTALQKRNAENSINFFEWRPAANQSEREVFAVLEQLDQAGVMIEPAIRGEATVVDTWAREQDTNELIIQPFMVGYNGDCKGRVIEGGCDWSQEVNERWYNVAQGNLGYGMRFTTQNLPFVRTRTVNNQTGIRWVAFEPPGDPTVCSFNEKYYCYFSGSDWAETNVSVIADLLFSQEMDPSVDVILGFVPLGFFATSVIGVQTEDSTGRKLLLVELGLSKSATITHEIGHFFDLDHCPPNINGTACFLPPIQGFRMELTGRSGFNKHHAEGNQQSTVPMNQLMAPTEVGTHQQFITDVQYSKALGQIQTALEDQASLPVQDTYIAEPSWLEQLLLPSPAFAQNHGNGEQQQLIISGVARDGQIHINRMRVLPTSTFKDPPALKGPYQLELRNADGSMVQSYAFDLNKPDSWHDQEIPTSSFRISVPVPPGLHSIQISGPGGATVSAQASPNTPVVTARVTTNPNNGLRTLHWSASDVDGDTLKAAVYLKGDEGDWYGIAVDFSGSQLQIPLGNLPAAESVMARIIISDGFNNASTELDIGAGAPLSVLSSDPEDGARDVELKPEISAWISNPLQARVSTDGPVPLPTGQFTLSGPGGKAVPATVSYLGPEGVITLTPNQPLEPDSRYQVSLTGISDRWANPLAQPYNWSFETGPKVVDPEARTEPDDLSSDEPVELPVRPEGGVDSGTKSATQPVSSVKAGPGKDSPEKSDDPFAGGCSCECDQRARADELCELFCEEEFAMCESL